MMGNLSAMRRGFLLCLHFVTLAAAAPAETPASTPAPATPPPAAVTPAPVRDARGLPALAGMENRKETDWGPLVPEYSMEITAAGPSPADLTNRGFYQIQLFRSPQAARHFLTALRQDDGCAMAWVGLYLALLERGEEAKPVRDECFRRANALRRTTNEHEQAWVDAMAALHLRGTRAFAAALDTIRQRWPDDRNAQIWLPLMLRDGYDIAKAPRAGQRAAVALLELMLEKYPDDPVVLHAWCQIALVGPKPEDAIGQARLLLAFDPPSAYFRQAAGLVLFRAGDAAAAAAAFDAARRFEEKSLPAEGLAPVAAPTYFDNIDCLAIALTEAGRRDDALSVARAARAIDLPWSLPHAAAVREFAFFTQTSEARVHARCGEWKQAKDALPAPDHPAVQSSRFAGTWLQFLRTYFDGRLAIADNDKARLASTLKSLESLLASMGDMTPEARAEGLDPQWSEAYRLADFLQYDLRAESNFANNDRTMAALWWRSATARQVPGTVRAVPRWPRTAAESMASRLRPRRRQNHRPPRLGTIRARPPAIRLGPARPARRPRRSRRCRRSRQGRPRPAIRLGRRRRLPAAPHAGQRRYRVSRITPGSCPPHSPAGSASRAARPTGRTASACPPSPPRAHSRLSPARQTPGSPPPPRPSNTAPASAISPPTATARPAPAPPTPSSHLSPSAPLRLSLFPLAPLAGTEAAGRQPRPPLGQRAGVRGSSGAATNQHPPLSLPSSVVLSCVPASSSLSSPTPSSNTNNRCAASASAFVRPPHSAWMPFTASLSPRTAAPTRSTRNPSDPPQSPPAPDSNQYTPPRSAPRDPPPPPPHGSSPPPPAARSQTPRSCCGYRPSHSVPVRPCFRLNHCVKRCFSVFMNSPRSPMRRV